ncbi:hypothetical protein JJD84_11440 [Pseudomonas fluorescens]|nr:hypothetical protein [Pseudomonas fluorescens]
MHSTQINIIAFGIILALAGIAYVTLRGIRRATAGTYQRGLSKGRQEQSAHIEALNSDLAMKEKKLKLANESAEVRTAEFTQRLSLLGDQLQQLKASPLIPADHQLLAAIAGTLDLALQTWQPLKGTKPVVERVTAQKQSLAKLIARSANLVDATAFINRDSLDTRLIEFLNTKGDLWGDLESSTLTFPHDANPDGYPHVRDALREAVEQEDLRLQREFSGEDAA